MKPFKMTELAVNLGLLLLFLFQFIRHEPSLLFLYYIIGGWQVAGMLVHTFAGWFMKPGGPRDVFQLCVAAAGLFVVLSNWIPFFFFIWFFLLVGAPVMAVIYTLICLEELRLLKHRPLSALK